MITSEEKRLLEWIDQFIFDRYRAPTLEDIQGAAFRFEPGWRAGTLELKATRLALIDNGHLIPSPLGSMDQPIYFIPSWMKSFIDFQAHRGAGYHKLLEAIKNHGHNKAGA